MEEIKSQVQHNIGGLLVSSDQYFIDPEEKDYSVLESLNLRTNIVAEVTAEVDKIVAWVNQQLTRLQTNPNHKALLSLQLSSGDLTRAIVVDTVLRMLGTRLLTEEERKDAKRPLHTGLRTTNRPRLYLYLKQSQPKPGAKIEEKYSLIVSSEMVFPEEVIESQKKAKLRETKPAPDSGTHLDPLAKPSPPSPMGPEQKSPESPEPWKEEQEQPRAPIAGSSSEETTPPPPKGLLTKLAEKMTGSPPIPNQINLAPNVLELNRRWKQKEQELWEINRKLQEQTYRLEKEIRERAKEISDWKQKEKTAKEKGEQFHGQVEKLTGEKTNLTQTITQQQKAQEDQRTGLNQSFGEKIKSLENKLSLLIREKDGLSQNLNSKQLQLGKTEQERANLTQVLSRREESEKQAITEVNLQWQEKLKILETRLADSNKVFEQLREKEKQREKAEQEKDDLIQVISQREKTHQQQLAALNHRWKEKMGLLENKLGDTNRILRQAKDLDQELTKLKQEKDILNQAIAQKVKEGEQREIELNNQWQEKLDGSVQAKENEIKESIAKLQNENINLTQEISQLNEKLQDQEKLGQQVEKLVREKSNLTQTITQQQEALEDQKVELNQSFGEKIKSLENKLSLLIREKDGLSQKLNITQLQLGKTEQERANLTQVLSRREESEKQAITEVNLQWQEKLKILETRLADSNKVFEQLREKEKQREKAEQEKDDLVQVISQREKTHQQQLAALNHRWKEKMGLLENKLDGTTKIFRQARDLDQELTALKQEREILNQAIAQLKEDQKQHEIELNNQWQEKLTNLVKAKEGELGNNLIKLQEKEANLVQEIAQLKEKLKEQEQVKQEKDQLAQQIVQQAQSFKQQEGDLNLQWQEKIAALETQLNAQINEQKRALAEAREAAQAAHIPRQSLLSKLSKRISNRRQLTEEIRNWQRQVGELRNQMKRAEQEKIKLSQELSQREQALTKQLLELERQNQGLSEKLRSTVSEAKTLEPTIKELMSRLETKDKAWQEQQQKLREDLTKQFQEQLAKSLAQIKGQLPAISVPSAKTPLELKDQEKLDQIQREMEGRFARELETKEKELEEKLAQKIEQAKPSPEKVAVELREIEKKSSKEARAEMKEELKKVPKEKPSGFFRAVNDVLLGEEEEEY